ncbi:hypothetical protein FRB94_009502 [Tulasnella sp. JGI-2019a]|nr:hypothetical protein FRB93_008364 [Tulasnella sp. JGI-2019a]KAG8995028.1 hypothetical protein FRB94_009502 [Tulasnella sp. JGI-2019a]KAG9024356.1 hypothetical protein FRB95_011623 [Tulasnella sp. JGI-2019a]
MSVSSLGRSVTRANLTPTVSSLPSGVPKAAYINFVARAPHDAHAHGHGGSPAQRSDKVPSWVGGLSMNGSAFRTKANAAPTTPGSLRHLHTSVSKKEEPHVPDYAPYKASSDSGSRALSYFLIGSMGVVTASLAKSTVTGFLSSMSASADVLALAKVEVDMNNIPEGKNVVIKWRGKPVFIRHRTAEEIEEANQVDFKSLRDPESDEARTKKPEWLVMLGVCTHLGCVPIGESGDYGGWFCPCHGSHYDISGRIRKGPAPLNLEVPAYSFDEGAGKIIVG